MRRSRCGVGLLAVWIGIVLVPVGAQESQPGEKSARTQEGPRPAPRQELEELRLELYELRGAQHQNQRRMESIESRLRALGGGEPIRIDPASDQEDRKPGDEALDAALEELGRADEDAPPPPVSSTPGLWSRPVGPVRLRLIDVSFDVLFAAGGSTERDESLGNLQGGEHDPRKRGFTLQNAELSLVGAVDPYLYAEAHVIYFIDPSKGRASSSWRRRSPPPSSSPTASRPSWGSSSRSSASSTRSILTSGTSSISRW